MHDVEGELAIVGAGVVHAKVLFWAVSIAASPNTTTRPLPNGMANA